MLECQNAAAVWARAACGGTPVARLTGKVALVTGASKGIGAGVAKAMAAEGAQVAVNYAESRADADAVVAAIAAAGGDAAALQADVSKPAEARGLVAATVARFGRLDILVNNAGVFEFSRLEAITEAHFHKIFDLNVLGVLMLAAEAAQHMGEGSSIINIGSTITTVRPPGSAVYAASKAAVDVISVVLAKELGGRGIRVNSLAPGRVITEGTQSAGIATAEWMKTTAAITPLGRPGRPEDIAAAAVFLASSEAGWITGDRITASGGLT